PSGLTAEANRTCEPVAAGRGEPRVATPEAEAHREDAVDPVLTEMLDGGGDVRLDGFRRRLAYVRHVLERLVALLSTRSAPEVIERERCIAPLGEPQRELLVEAIEPTNVREDDDADAVRLVGSCGEGGEPVPILRLEDEVVVRDGRSGDDRDRRGRVELE